MDNKLTVFNNADFGEIRTLEENGTVLFNGADVAKALGYSNPRDAVSRHCKGVVKRDGVSLTTNQHGVTTEQTVEMNFIPEGDVYRLIARSKLPTAERFESWVFDEVLPSIRKNGGYIAGQETFSPEELMAKALLVAQKTIEEKNALLSRTSVELSAAKVENEIMRPKAGYFDEVVDRNLLTNFRETAKELGIKPKTFVNFLIEKKYIYRDKRGKLLPYEDKNDGLFEVKECFNEKTQWAGTQTLVTPKGRETFRLLCQGL